MLCPSVSTGVLSNLLPTVSHAQGLGLMPDAERTSELQHHAQQFYAHVLSAPRSNLASPASQHLKSSAEETRSIEGGDWDFEGTNSVPWPTFRKVQSENDLQALGRSSSCSANFATVDSLISGSQLDEGNDDTLFHGDSFGGHRLSRRCRRTKLRRHLSLSVINSGSSESLVSQLDTIIPEAAESLVEVANELKDISSVSCSFLNASALIGMQYMGELRSCKTSTLAREKESRTLWESSGSGSQNAGGLATTDSTDAGLISLLESSMTTSFHKGQALMCTGRHDNIASMRFGFGSTVESPVLEVLEGNTYTTSQKESFGPMFITDLGIGNGGSGSGRSVSGGRSGGGYGDPNGVEAQYQRMLEADPGHPLLLRNYARFLHKVKGDSLKAEAYYERAILACPDDGEVLGQYAQLIWEVYKDEARAGRYFDQALHACPDDCFLNAAYASFLWSSESDEPELAECHDKYSNVPSMYGIAAAAVSA